MTAFGGQRSLELARRSGALGDEHALAVPDLDDAHHREAVQRLADGRAPDAHPLRQLPFGRQACPGGQFSHRIQDLLRNRLGQLPPGRLLINSSGGRSSSSVTRLRSISSISTPSGSKT